MKKIILNYMISKFKICKSVHHRTIQINHQPDVTVFQFIIPTFVYSSTCFGCSPAHHQELNDCSSSLWFTFVSYRSDSSVVGRGRAGRPDHDQQHCYHQTPTINQRLLLKLL